MPYNLAVVSTGRPSSIAARAIVKSKVNKFPFFLSLTYLSLEFKGRGVHTSGMEPIAFV
jgi:hypothetical protein